MTSSSESWAFLEASNVVSEPPARLNLGTHDAGTASLALCARQIVPFTCGLVGVNYQNRHIFALNTIHGVHKRIILNHT